MIFEKHPPKRTLFDGRKRHAQGIPEEGKSLGDLYPEISSEFVKPVYNDEAKQELDPYDYKPTQEQIVKFKCRKCGTEWKSRIASRVKGKGVCPNCNKKIKTSFGENYIAGMLKVIVPDTIIQKQIYDTQMYGDIFIPSLKLMIEYGQTFYHKNKESDKIKQEFCDDNNYDMLYILEDQDCKYVETTDGQITIPSKQYVRNLSNLNKAIEIICVDYNLRNVVQKEERDKIIGEAFKKQIGNVKKEDTLGVRYPSIADEWDTDNNYGISPYEIRYNSYFDANWINRQTGKRWMASVQRRTRKFQE